MASAEEVIAEVAIIEAVASAFETNITNDLERRPSILKDRLSFFWLSFCIFYFFGLSLPFVSLSYQ